MRQGPIRAGNGIYIRNDATGTVLEPDERWTPSNVTPVPVHVSQSKRLPSAVWTV